MPRKPIGEKAMTDAERQARYRVARAADAPVIRTVARPTIAVAPGVGRTPSPSSASCKRSMPIGSKRCRPTNTTARWPRPSRLSANSISPNSRAWRPTRLRTRLTFQRRTLKTSQRVAPSGSQTPGLTTGATPPAVHPRGPTGTPRATLRQPRGGRVATRGSPLWTPGMNRSR